QFRLVERGDLRRIGDCWPGELRHLPRQERVSRGEGELNVAGQGTHDYRVDRASVDLVALQDECGMPIAGLRPSRLTEVRPPDFAAADQRCLPMTALLR